MRDLLPSSGPNVFETGIINLDDNRGCGTHWVAYKKYHDNVMYFDSFGNLQPPLELISYFKNCNIKYNIDMYQKLRYNCGHLCLQFLYQK